MMKYIYSSSSPTLLAALALAAALFGWAGQAGATGLPADASPGATPETILAETPLHQELEALWSVRADRANAGRKLDRQERRAFYEDWTERLQRAIEASPGADGDTQAAAWIESAGMFAGLGDPGAAAEAFLKAGAVAPTEPARLDSRSMAANAAMYASRGGDDAWPWRRTAALHAEVLEDLESPTLTLEQRRFAARYILMLAQGYLPAAAEAVDRPRRSGLGLYASIPLADRAALEDMVAALDRSVSGYFGLLDDAGREQFRDSFSFRVDGSLVDAAKMHAWLGRPAVAEARVEEALSLDPADRRLSDVEIVGQTLVAAAGQGGTLDALAPALLNRLDWTPERVKLQVAIAGDHSLSSVKAVELAQQAYRMADALPAQDISDEQIAWFRGAAADVVGVAYRELGATQRASEWHDLAVAARDEARRLAAETSAERREP
jgi:tetratricopeptide (TPR) repeat protein